MGFWSVTVLLAFSYTRPPLRTITRRVTGDPGVNPSRLVVSDIWLSPHPVVVTPVACQVSPGRSTAWAGMEGVAASSVPTVRTADLSLRMAVSFIELRAGV